MNILRKKVEDELNQLDNQGMAAVYEHLRQINYMRRTAQKRRSSIPDINKVLELTSSSKGSWAESIVLERDERL